MRESWFGWDMGMVARHEKIRIEVFAPADKVAVRNSRGDESLLRLARLIGRQMAREAFEREQAKPLPSTKPHRCRRPS
jgi:hypothetical protein